MTVLKIQINMDNDSFQDNTEEIQILLDRIKFDLNKGYVKSMIRDSNGNIVGDFMVEED